MNENELLTRALQHDGASLHLLRQRKRRSLVVTIVATLLYAVGVAAAAPHPALLAALAFSALPLSVLALRTGRLAGLVELIDLTRTTGPSPGPRSATPASEQPPLPAS